MANPFLIFWETAGRMAPWLLLGFGLAGALSQLVSPETVARYLGRRGGKKAILWAVALGVPLPLCSCGVLPVAAGLRKMGASRGAAAAFLIATPQTGVDSFFATYSLLGGAFAVFRPLVAIITGLVGGVLLDTGETPPPEKNAPGAETPAAAEGVGGKILAALRYGYWQLLGNVAPALALGLALSAAILFCVPDGFFRDPRLGGDWVAFPVMLLIGIPMYVCSTGSIPVALSLVAKGVSPGAALVFLIVGPSLNGASLAVLGKMLGKAGTALYLAVIAAGAVAAGVLMNALAAAGLVALRGPAGPAGAPGAGALTAAAAVCGIILTALLAVHLLKRGITVLFGKKKIREGWTRVTVEGMRCDHCRTAVTKYLAGCPGVTAVESAGKKAFDVDGELPETLAQDLEGLGFTLAGTERG